VRSGEGHAGRVTIETKFRAADIVQKQKGGMVHRA
jgi:hypothetical protein